MAVGVGITIERNPDLVLCSTITFVFNSLQMTHLVGCIGRLSSSSIV